MCFPLEGSASRTGIRSLCFRDTESLVLAERRGRFRLSGGQQGEGKPREIAHDKEEDHRSRHGAAEPTVSRKTWSDGQQRNARHHWQEEEIVRERGRNVAMQEGVKRPRIATAGTVQPCELMKEAGRQPRALPRFVHVDPRTDGSASHSQEEQTHKHSPSPRGE